MNQVTKKNSYIALYTLARLYCIKQFFVMKGGVEARVLLRYGGTDLSQTSPIAKGNSFMQQSPLAISDLIVFLSYIWQGSSRFKLRNEIFLLDDTRRTYYLIQNFILGNIDSINVYHIPAYKTFKARGAS